MDQKSLNDQIKANNFSQKKKSAGWKISNNETISQDQSEAIDLLKELMNRKEHAANETLQ